MKATIRIRLKEGILDPQGQAVNNALHHLNFPMVKDVRIGKLIEMWINVPDREQARQIAEEASKKLLANPVIETYEIEISEETR